MDLLIESTGHSRDGGLEAKDSQLLPTRQADRSSGNVPMPNLLLSKSQHGVPEAEPRQCAALPFCRIVPKPRRRQDGTAQCAELTDEGGAGGRGRGGSVRLKCDLTVLISICSSYSYDQLLVLGN